MKRYPYDYTGTLAENRFEETRQVLSIDNSDRVIILKHAPFFPNLKISVEGSSIPLKVGVDYELVYQLTPLEQIASDDLYCGIQLLSPLVTGELKFEGNTVGGDFVDPIQEILDALVKHLNSPLSGKWEDVGGIPALMPKMATYRDWADLLNTHYLADAIDGFADKIADGQLNEEEAIAALLANVRALDAAIDSFDYPSHIAAKNPHNTTQAQINAHPKNMAAADAVMAYSKDFFTLCDYVRSRGLTEAQLQAYLSEYLVGNVQGTFSFNDGVATIESQDGTAYLDMNSGRITISSKGSIFMQADSDVKSSGESYKFLSGDNELKIASSGPHMSDQRIYLNGHEILNNRTIKSYQGDPGGGVSTVVITESSTINLTGDGTEGNPITGTLIIPTATPTVAGKARIKHTGGTEGDGWVAHPKTVKAISDDIQTLVPTARRLNDKELKGSSISLDKGDAKLGKVDNTADAAKPLSTDLTAAIALLAGANHTHDWPDLNIGHATLYDEGIALIANDHTNIPDNQGVSPKVLNLIKAELNALLPRYADSMVATDLEFASVAESSFSISGFTLTPTEPVGYMLSKNGKLVEATFSGNVDISGIPNDEWFAPENDCESRWSKAVIYTNAPNYGKPPAAEYISLTADYGKVGGKIAFKKRLKFKNNEIIFKIAADDAYVIYIDGKEVLTGGGSVLATQDVVIEPGRYVVGIELRDGGGKGYLSFEIYDGDELIDVSDESWPCAELPDVVEATNNRFYLYGDITTGGFVARATAIEVDSVSSSHLFIGNLETNYTQVKPNAGDKVAFETTIDYGIFNELKLHYVEENAHGGTGETDIVGLENVTGSDVCNGSTVDDVPYLLRITTDEVGSEGAVKVSNVITSHRRVGSEPTDMFHFITGHCPAQYHCIENKLAGDEYTVEGMLHVRTDIDPTDSPSWLFVAEGKDTDEVLVVTPDVAGGTSKFTIESYAKLTPSKDPKSLPADAVTELTVTSANVQGGNYNVFPSGSNADPYMLAFVKYRYLPRTNVLTLLFGFEGGYSCIEYTFDRNMASFFNKKAVGCRTTRPTIFGGVVDNFNIPEAISRRVTSYRALFEAYLSGTDISRYAEGVNGITVHTDKYGTPHSLLTTWTHATELLYNSTSQGEVFGTHGQPLPAAFCKMDWYLATDRPNASKSKFHEGETGDIFIIPGGSVWNPSSPELVLFTKVMDLPSELAIEVGSIGDMIIRVNGAHVQDVPGSALTAPVRLPAAGSGALIEVQVASVPGKPSGFWAKQGSTPFVGTDWTYTGLRSLSEIVEFRMPWHTCQSAWDKVLNLIENE